jgi:hypothetical protein
MLYLLARLPRLGVQLEDFYGASYYHKLVLVRRGWTLRILYRLSETELLVEFIDPSWLRRSAL